MHDLEIAELKDFYIKQIEKMRTSAGSMIHTLLDAVVDTRNGGPVYIRLTDADVSDVIYEVLEGDRNVVKRVGLSLGLVVTNNMIRMQGR